MIKKCISLALVLLLAAGCALATTPISNAIAGGSGTVNYQIIGWSPNSNAAFTQIAQFLDTGSANSYSATLATTNTILENSLVEFMPAHTNTSASTLNITVLGSKSITKCGTTALVAGDIVMSVPAMLVYDGTEYQLINPQAVGCPAQDSGTARGVATLSSGTASVSTSAACTVGSTCTYQLTNCGPAGTLGVTLAIGTQAPGSSFVINSLTAGSVVATDNSVVCWRIN